MSSNPPPGKRPSTSKRAPHSTTTSASASSATSSSSSNPPPPLTAHPSAIIAAHAHLSGPHRVSLGARAVLSPYSRVLAGAGPVSLGDGCVLWEKSVVGVPAAAGPRASPFPAPGEKGEEKGGGEEQGQGVRLGRNVVVETGCVVEAAEVGEGTVVEAGCRLGRGCVVGKYCTITPATTISANSHVPDFTVVLGGGRQRRADATLRDRADVREMRDRAHALQLEALRGRVPSQLVKWQMG